MSSSSIKKPWNSPERLHAMPDINLELYGVGPAQGLILFLIFILGALVLYRSDRTARQLPEDCAEADLEGITTHCVTVSEDIRLRKVAEERLRLSEHRLRLLAEHAREVIWTMSPKGELIFISPAVRSLLGFTPAQVMQLSWAEILTPSSHAHLLGYFAQLQVDMASKLQPRKYVGELEFCGCGGTSVCSEVFLHPLLGDKGLVEILGLSRDISEHRKRRMELERQASEQAESILAL